MGIIIFILGFAFVLAGILSITGITDVGMKYANYLQLQNLSFLQQYPDTWIYIGLGLILILLAFLFSRGRR